MYVCAPCMCNAHRGQKRSHTGGSWLRGPWALDESLSLLEIVEQKEKVRSDSLNTSVAPAEAIPVYTGLNSESRDQ